mgnify:CR=1 FL=1|tara:strand:- start:182 stop:991 length:810 start_codon:yes stop_codon:yes gene_type:complete
MTKLNIEYFYNKGKKLKKNWDDRMILWENSIEDYNKVRPYYKQKIENFLIDFLKLKNLKNYHLVYSLKNRFKIYYKKKYLILDIEFIFNKKTNNFIDFIVNVPGFKLKSEIILQNFNIINKLYKNLSKKDLLLKKYNILVKQFINKRQKAVIKCDKIFNGMSHKKNSNKNTLGLKITNNQYKFAKTFFLKKELYFKELYNVMNLNHYPHEIEDPTSLKVESINSDLYKVIINCTPSKEHPQGFYSFEMDMSQLDKLLWYLATKNCFSFK